MSGNFARGFMETFPTSFAMASKRKQDAWDKTWDKWNQREELDRKARDDFNKVQSEASSIVQTYGQGRVPEGAESLLTEKMMRGMSRQEAIKLVQEGKWAPTELPAGQVNPDRTQQSQAEQQTDAMMGVNQPQMPQQEPQGLLGGLVSQGKSFLQNMRLSPEEKALQDFAKEQGITVDQLKQRMSNGAVSVIPEAEANAQQAQRFSAQMPKPVQEPIAGIDPNAILSQRNALAKEIRDPIFKLETRKKSLNELYKISGDNFKLINEVGPQVLTSVAAPTAQFIRNLEAEAKGFIALLDDPNADKAGIAQQAQKRVGELESQIESLLGKGITTTAQAKELYEMRRQLGAFTLATIYGQEGRSLSNEERKLFEQVLSPGVDPLTYMQNMQALLEIQTNITNGMAQTISTTFGADIQNHNEIAKQYHPNFLLNVDVKTYEESIKGTPQEEYYNQIMRNQTQVQTQESPLNQPDSEFTPMPMDQAIQMYKQNPSEELRKFFMDTYGKDPNGL